MGRVAETEDKDGAMEIARRVRLFRTQADMTQEELARAANVTPKFVSQLENGHVNASIGVLRRVVEDGLQIPLALFFGSDPDEDVVGDAATLLGLLASQPARVRRCAIRLVRALIDCEQAPPDGGRSRGDGRGR